MELSDELFWKTAVWAVWQKIDLFTLLDIFMVLLLLSAAHPPFVAFQLSPQWNPSSLFVCLKIIYLFISASFRFCCSLFNELSHSLFSLSCQYMQNSGPMSIFSRALGEWQKYVHMKFMLRSLWWGILSFGSKYVHDLFEFALWQELMNIAVIQSLLFVSFLYMSFTLLPILLYFCEQ